MKKLFLPKPFCQSQNVTREKLPKKLSYKKRVFEMLMKLTPDIYQDNIYRKIKSAVSVFLSVECVQRWQLV